MSTLYEGEAAWLLAAAGGGTSTFLEDDFPTLLAQYRAVAAAGDAPPPPPGTRSARTAALLAALGNCSQLPWVPVATAYLRPRLDAEGRARPGAVHDKDAFLAALDQYVFFLLVTRTKAAAWEHLHRLVKVIHRGGDPLRAMRLGAAEWRALRAALSEEGLGAKRNGVLATVLRRAKAAVRASADRRASAATGGGWSPSGGTAADAAHRGWTVEHVLPLKVPDGSAWARHVPEPGPVRQCLGNLTLLDAVTNSRASNRSFADKKRAYQDKEGAAMAALTAKVVAADVWNGKVITRRWDRLIDLLLEPYQATSKS